MTRKILGLVASVVLAVVGAFLVLSYVNNADERAAAGEEQVAVLVVSDTIDAGERAADLSRKVATELVPARMQAEAAVASLDQLAGQVAAVTLLPGEQLLATRFITEEEREETVGVEVPVGYLQVTVSLSPERAVGGQLVPGDLVAFVASFDPFRLGAIEPTGAEPDDLARLIIATTNSQEGEEGSESSTQPPSNLQTPNTSHIILHKVLVTAVQVERLPAETDREDAANVGVELAPTGNLLVTLAATAADVERMVFSAEHGSVWLAEEPERASERGTEIVHRGSIYR